MQQADFGPPGVTPSTMCYSSYDFTRQKDGYLGMTNLMCPLKQRVFSKLVTEMEISEIGAHREFVAGF